ncbi:MAG: hypothetical protein D6736_07090 [Nitrospinota bacterium]|nr:MAG: hypothetical protein D6736_07090 [Nitrospinota bacterium]
MLLVGLGLYLLGGMSWAGAASRILILDDFEDCDPNLEIWFVPEIEGSTSSGLFTCDTEEKAGGKRAGRVTVKLKSGELRFGRTHKLPKFAGYRGIGLHLKGTGLKHVVLSIYDSQEVWYSPRIKIRPDWTEVRIPFKLFVPEAYEKSKLPKHPTIDDAAFGLWFLLTEPYTRNKPGTSGTLWVDDIFLYR